MKYKRILYVLCLAGLVLTLGCRKNTELYGRVSYPDGTPLHKGTVYFQDEIKIAWGDIGTDGSFRLGMDKVGNGIPPGRYNVYVSGAIDIEEVPPPAKEGDPIIDPKKTFLIDKRFMSPEHSGITCTVERGMKLPYNITVDYPNSQNVASKR